MHGGWNPGALRAVLAAIQDAGFTQGDLAKLARVNRSQVNRWARGENRPAYDRALLLARRIARDYPGLAAEFMAASGYGAAEAEPEPDSLGIAPEDDHERYILAHPDLSDDDKRLMIASHRKYPVPAPAPPAAPAEESGATRPGSAAS